MFPKDDKSVLAAKPWNTSLDAVIKQQQKVISVLSEIGVLTTIKILLM